MWNLSFYFLLSFTEINLFFSKKTIKQCGNFNCFWFCFGSKTFMFSKGVKFFDKHLPKYKEVLEQALYCKLLQKTRVQILSMIDPD
jgi:hypothetical protein